MTNNKIFLIVGPSGSGKSTVVNKIKKDFKKLNINVGIGVSTTTRPIRNNEVDGVDYHFVTKQEFNKLDLLESTTYDDNYYGITETEIEELYKNHLYSFIVVDEYGKNTIKQAYPERCISVYISVSPDKALANLTTRDGKDKAIARWQNNIRSGVYDINKDEYDYIIHNSQKSLKPVISKMKYIMKLDDKIA